MIFHTVVIDVSTGTCSGRSTVEIPQGDKDSHQILIKLVQGDQFYHIDEGSSVEMTFYDSFDHELFTSLAPKIANYYRGYVTYVVGERLIRDFGRFVSRVDVYDKLHDRKASARFIIDIVKSDFNDQCGCGCGCNDSQVEVVITKDFYKTLLCHLRDNTRHLTDEDRDLLNFIAENQNAFITYDNLGKALQNDPEINEILRSTITEIVKDVVPEIGDVSQVKQDVKEIQDTLNWNTLNN